MVDRNVDVSNGEAILLITTERSWLFLAAFAGKHLAAKSTLGNVVTPAELALAAPAVAKVEVVIFAWLVTVTEIRPVIAALLLVGTLVVVVLRSVVVGSLTVPVSGDVLGSKARN